MKNTRFPVVEIAEKRVAIASKERRLANSVVTRKNEGDPLTTSESH